MHHHHDSTGVLGIFLGFFGYLIAHGLDFIIAIEQKLPAVFLAAICSFIGYMVQAICKHIHKKFLKNNEAN